MNYTHQNDVITPCEKTNEQYYEKKMSPVTLLNSVTRISKGQGNTHVNEEKQFDKNDYHGAQ